MYYNGDILPITIMLTGIIRMMHRITANTTEQSKKKIH